MKRMFYLLCIILAINNSPLLASSSEQDPATVLITGSNRGIGLALAEHYAKEGWKVIATCRKPNQAEKLKTIGQVSSGNNRKDRCHRYADHQKGG